MGEATRKGLFSPTRDRHRIHPLPRPLHSPRGDGGWFHPALPRRHTPDRAEQYHYQNGSQGHHRSIDAATADHRMAKHEPLLQPVLAQLSEIRP